MRSCSRRRRPGCCAAAPAGRAPGRCRRPPRGRRRAPAAAAHSTSPRRASRPRRSAPPGARGAPGRTPGRGLESSGSCRRRPAAAPAARRRRRSRATSSGHTIVSRVRSSTSPGASWSCSTGVSEPGGRRRRRGPSPRPARARGRPAAGVDQRVEPRRLVPARRRRRATRSRARRRAAPGRRSTIIGSLRRLASAGQSCTSAGRRRGPRPRSRAPPRRRAWCRRAPAACRSLGAPSASAQLSGGHQEQLGPGVAGARRSSAGCRRWGRRVPSSRIVPVPATTSSPVSEPGVRVS